MSIISLVLCLRRYHRVCQGVATWAARRSKQSILKEITSEYALEGLLLKLKQLWPPDVKSRLTGKDLDTVKNLRQKEKGLIDKEVVG